MGHRNVIKCSPHPNGDICTTRGNNLKTSFSYMSQNVKKNYILGYLGGPEGGSSMIRLGISCFPAISSHPYLCTCQIRKQSDKKFLSLNPKYEKIYFFFIFGGHGGPLCRTQVNENFRAVRPHHRADICITRE